MPCSARLRGLRLRRAAVSPRQFLIWSEAPNSRRTFSCTQIAAIVIGTQHRFHATQIFITTALERGLMSIAYTDHGAECSHCLCTSSHTKSCSNKVPNEAQCFGRHHLVSQRQPELRVVERRPSTSIRLSVRGIKNVNRNNRRKFTCAWPKRAARCSAV